MRILNIDFSRPNPDREGNSAAGAFDWVVHAESELRDGTHIKYSLVFELLSGRLTYIRRFLANS
jgi:hypothetical protein